MNDDTRIEFDDDGKPDGCMRRRFTLHWTQDGKKRGQCFHARPEFYGFSQDGTRREPMRRTHRTENGRDDE